MHPTIFFDPAFVVNVIAGWFLTAVSQSVGAGCRPGGTLSIQMRHMPAGGR